MIDRLDRLIMCGDCLPHTVYLELTNRCSFNCQGCTTPKGEAVDFNFEWVEALAYSLLENDINKMILTGGEPTLHPKFQEILSQFKTLDFEVGLETNGESLGKHIEACVRNCAWIKIPVETVNTALFAENRGCCDGRLRGILFNLYQLRNKIKDLKTDTKIIIEILVDEFNKDAPIQIKEGLFYLGKNTSMLIHPRILNGEISPNTIGELFTQWNGWQTYNGFSINVDPTQEAWGLIPPEQRKCYHSFFNSYIAADGSVLRCRDCREEANMFGSLAVNRWPDIWDGLVRTDLLQNFDIKNCPQHCVGSTTNIKTRDYLDRGKTDVIHRKP